MPAKEYQSMLMQANTIQDTPAWSSHVLIPVAQNVLGGVAVAGLAMMGVYAYGAPIENGAGVWCAFGGAAVTCIITITRFFGDDLGLLTAAYKAGRVSRDAQIAALELELRASRDAQTAAEADGNQASADKRREEFRQRARKDAATIVAVHFDGDSIARAPMQKRGIAQRDWERAMRLLKASGVVNGDGVVVIDSPGKAIRAIDAKLASSADKGKTFTPSWK